MRLGVSAPPWLCRSWLRGQSQTRIRQSTKRTKDTMTSCESTSCPLVPFAMKAETRESAP